MAMLPKKISVTITCGRLRLVVFLPILSISRVLSSFRDMIINLQYNSIINKEARRQIMTDFNDFVNCFNTLYSCEDEDEA